MSLLMVENSRVRPWSSTITTDPPAAHEYHRDFNHTRVKKRKLETYEVNRDSLLHGQPTHTLGSYPTESMCPHPAAYGGICLWCTQHVKDDVGVTFPYIDKHLRFAHYQVARLRDENLKRLLRQRKLSLVLDLDHTLLNSTRLVNSALPVGSNLHRLDAIQMMTKLRPYVHTFLKEASQLFELYIYTLGERRYALEMAKLLDPEGIYFGSRIFAKEDCVEEKRKSLDIMLGHESAVLVLDDTPSVWQNHKDNVIVMKRYHYFSSSCKQFGLVNTKSLSEKRSDESEGNGVLATILKVLRQIHCSYFYQLFQLGSIPDVRQVLKTVRNEVLRGCRIVFTSVFPVDSDAESHPLWQMAVQLGATCSTVLDSSVTHVISRNAGTEKSLQAVRENKFLVNYMWIKDAYYFSQRQPEQNYHQIC